MITKRELPLLSPIKPLVERGRRTIRWTLSEISFKFGINWIFFSIFFWYRPSYRLVSFQKFWKKKLSYDCWIFDYSIRNKLKTTKKREFFCHSPCSVQKCLNPAKFVFILSFFTWRVRTKPYFDNPTYSFKKNPRDSHRETKWPTHSMILISGGFLGGGWVLPWAPSFPF